jgi:hypothetical protein
MLNMAGVTLAYFYGYPQPSFEETVGLAMQGDAVEGHQEEVRGLRKRHLFWSRTGLAVMFVGFLLQFAGLLMSAAAPDVPSVPVQEG